jgi:solute carrier family 35 (UDP-xylose/UDP-N-acetylglucosamine transporter), member B4
MPQLNELLRTFFVPRKFSGKMHGGRRGKLQRFSLLASDMDLVAHAVLDECFVDHHIVRRHSLDSLRETDSSLNDEDGTKQRILRRGKSAAAVLIRSTIIEDGPDEEKLPTFAEYDAHEEKSDFYIPESDDENLGKQIEKATDPSGPIDCEINNTFRTDVDKPEESSLHYVLVFSGVLLGSIAANAAFERLNVIDPGCGSVIALLQYVVATAERLPSAPRYITNPAIPLRFHASFCLLQFLATWLGNTCLAFDLPFAQYLIIKNSNLVFSMAVGALALRQRYSPRQVLSVILLSLGIILTVVSDSDTASGSDTHQQAITGVLLCLASTLCTVVLGFMQEHAFRTFKDKDGSMSLPAEAMFYTHVLGLPFFFTSGAQAHFVVLVSQWQSSFPLVVVNVGAMVLCKFCIFALVDLSGSLTTAMTMTLARFLGIVVSVCFLSNRALPGMLFWLGSAGVVAGSSSYLLGNRNAVK